MDKESLPLFFAFFNEVGIIEQLSRNAFESVLPSGFLISHFSVLNYLVRVQDGRTPFALASAFQLPKTTITHTLANLEKHNMIEIRPNPDDGRSKCVWLTDKGRQFREQAITAIGQELSSISSVIDTAKIKTTMPLLIEIRSYLDQNRKTKGIN